jgi:hypothetical protein
MAEALTELHRHEGDDLHRFAGTGLLFDKHGTIGSAHIGDEAGLIRTKRFAACGVQGGFSGQAETQEHFSRSQLATKGALFPCVRCRLRRPDRSPGLSLLDIVTAPSPRRFGLCGIDNPFPTRVGGEASDNP